MKQRNAIAPLLLLSLSVFACGGGADEATAAAPAEAATGTVSEPLTDATTWIQDGTTNQKAHVNAYDTTIGIANVGSVAARWTSAGSSPTNASVVGGVAYTGASDGTIRAFNTTTGATIWSRNFGGHSYYAPAVAFGRVYVTVNKTLFVLSATSGAFIYRTDHTSDVSYSAPLIADNKVFVRDWNGTIWAYDAKATGTVTPLFSFAANASADPSSANGIVYVPSYDGVVYAYSSAGCAGSCAPSWRSAPLGGVSYFSPVVWPPRLILTVYGDTGTVTEQALDSSNGASLWSKTLTGATDSTGPAVGYGRAFVSLSGVNEVWALSLTDGSLAWKAPLAADPTDIPSLANQLLYVPSGRATGHLQVFSTTCGSGGATCISSKDLPADAYAYSPSIASGQIFLSASGGTTMFSL